jgi:hypothetical protein
LVLLNDVVALLAPLQVQACEWAAPARLTEEQHRSGRQAIPTHTAASAAVHLQGCRHIGDRSEIVRFFGTKVTRTSDAGGDGVSSAILAAQRPTRNGGPASASSVRPRRRPWLLVGGLLSMVVSAGAFALVYLGSDARQQVLVVARSVAAGQVLSSSDLRVARIVPGPDVDAVLAAEASRVIGHAAAVPLVPGSLLAPSQVGPVSWPPAGQAVVAVPVKAGRLADGVSAGAHVLIIPVAAPSAPTSASASGSAAGTATGGQPAVAGVVVSVRRDADGSGTAVVSVLIPADQAVSVAGGSGDVSVALARQ